MKGQRSGYRQDRSPRREMVSHQLDQHSNRIKELLRTDLTMLEEENAILKMKCKKVAELEEKVDLVLKQNSHLLTENQKMSRLLHQNKSENQILRNKIDAYSSQKFGISNEFQYEKKKLLKEIQHLSDELHESETTKNAYINELKAQFQLEIQAIKRHNQSSEEIYESEIRKLRELIERKEHELNEYTNKLKRHNTQSEYEVLKLKEDKEKLKNELIHCEADRRKDLQTLKLKLDANYLEEIQALKRNQLNNLQEMEQENMRYHEALNEKGQENQQLSLKLNKQRVYYEDSQHFLKRENQSLKLKMNQSQRMYSMQINELKDKLSMLHEGEIQQIQAKHMRQIQLLSNEVHKLQVSSNNKNIQIEQLIKDKTNARNLFDSEMSRLKDQINAVQYKLKDKESKSHQAINSLHHKVSEQEKHIDYLDQLNQTQNHNHSNDQNALQTIIDQLKKDINFQKLHNQETQQNLKESINQLQNQNAQLREAIKREQHEKQQIIEELKNQLNGNSSQFSSRIDALTTKNKFLEKENQALKNNILIKDKELKNLIERLRASQEREKKLESEIDQLRNKMVKKDQKSNELMIDQKNRLENAFAYNLENIKSDHSTALQLEAAKIRDLNEKLRKKEQQLDQLLKMYKKMTDQIEVLTEQEANKKQLTLKFPGATADLIATKNLFDVFLKTKVLNVCGDALDNRENKIPF